MKLSGINKGVELMLRSRKKVPIAKTCLMRFGKTVMVFRKKVTIYFEFSLDIMNQEVKEHSDGVNGSGGNI